MRACVWVLACAMRACVWVLACAMRACVWILACALRRACGLCVRTCGYSRGTTRNSRVSTRELHACFFSNLLVAVPGLPRYFLYIAIRDIFCHIAIQTCTGIDGESRR